MKKERGHLYKCKGKVIREAIKHANANGCTVYLYDNNGLGEPMYSDYRFPCPDGVLELHKSLQGKYYLELWYRKYKGLRIPLEK